ncbi:anthranilate phosphoribosyltransferase [Kribbella sp. NPDC051770]|uniref:anthranilate phosphoribosyltransferase n=1 Tax=Kribbella sp. NPDC051770 TaxID=3155413 RepID=UPI00341CE7D4
MALTARRTWSGLITDLLTGHDLTPDDAAWAMEGVVAGSATSAQVAGFLVALRAKGETPAEIAGFASVLRAAAVPVRLGGPLVDIVGTGGDRTGAVNISTMASLVVAATGSTVVKHGGRAASSATPGSADLVEALGVPLDLSPLESVQRAGIAFLHAPVYNPALLHVGAVRRELAVPTAFNVLGPLINPADPRHGLIGVADERMLPVVASVLASRDCSVLVVRGSDGLDKLTTTGPSRVLVVRDGAVTSTVFDPRSVGLAPCRASDLRAADPVTVVRRLLAGERGAVRDVVLLNAAAALSTLPGRPSLAGCLEDSAAAIDSGAAAATLDRWVGLA